VDKIQSRLYVQFPADLKGLRVNNIRNRNRFNSVTVLLREIRKNNQHSPTSFVWFSLFNIFSIKIRNFISKLAKNFTQNHLQYTGTAEIDGKVTVARRTLGHWTFRVWYTGSVGYGVSPVSTGRIYSNRHPSWAWPRQNQSSLLALSRSSAPITWLMNHSRSIQFVEFKTVEIWITNDYGVFHNSPNVKLACFLNITL
jgi:hypothetical protein